jgi:hypothetical protein
MQKEGGGRAVAHPGSNKLEKWRRTAGVEDKRQRRDGVGEEGRWGSSRLLTPRCCSGRSCEGSEEVSTARGTPVAGNCSEATHRWRWFWPNSGELQGTGKIGMSSGGWTRTRGSGRGQEKRVGSLGVRIAATDPVLPAAVAAHPHPITAGLLEGSRWGSGSGVRLGKGPRGTAGTGPRPVAERPAGGEEQGRGKEGKGKS